MAAANAVTDNSYKLARQAIVDKADAVATSAWESVPSRIKTGDLWDGWRADLERLVDMRKALQRQPDSLTRKLDPHESADGRQFKPRATPLTKSELSKMTDADKAVHQKKQADIANSAPVKARGKLLVAFRDRYERRLEQELGGAPPPRSVSPPRSTSPRRPPPPSSPVRASRPPSLPRPPPPPPPPPLPAPAAVAVAAFEPIVPAAVAPSANVARLQLLDREAQRYAKQSGDNRFANSKLTMMLTNPNAVISKVSDADDNDVDEIDLVTLYDTIDTNARFVESIVTNVKKLIESKAVRLRTALQSVVDEPVTTAQGTGISASELEQARKVVMAKGRAAGHGYARRRRWSYAHHQQGGADSDDDDFNNLGPVVQKSAFSAPPPRPPSARPPVIDVSSSPHPLDERVSIFTPVSPPPSVPPPPPLLSLVQSTSSSSSLVPQGKAPAKRRDRRSKSPMAPANTVVAQPPLANAVNKGKNYRAILQVAEILDREAKNLTPTLMRTRLLDAIASPTDGIASLTGQARSSIRQWLAQQIFSLSRSSAPFRGDYYLNIVLRGPAGSGKTKAAAVIAYVFRAMGVLGVGRFFETGPRNFASTYQGGSSQIMNDLFMAALESVLFIDEAYGVVGCRNGVLPDAGSTVGGTEAINALVHLMSLYSGVSCIIVAGYGRDMECFLSSNPGLTRRFAHDLTLSPYTGDDLTRMFVSSVERRLTQAEFNPSVLLPLERLYVRYIVQSLLDYPVASSSFSSSASTSKEDADNLKKMGLLEAQGGDVDSAATFFMARISSAFKTPWSPDHADARLRFLGLAWQDLVQRRKQNMLRPGTAFRILPVTAREWSDMTSTTSSSVPTFTGGHTNIPIPTRTPMAHRSPLSSASSWFRSPRILNRSSA